MNLISIDYAKLEAQLAVTHVCVDPYTLEMYGYHLDHHRLRAMEIFECGPDDVTPERRAFAKEANYIDMYSGLAATYGMHKDCGGGIIEDYSIAYEHEGAIYPAFRCQKCGIEIQGDAQIWIWGVDDVCGGCGEKTWECMCHLHGGEHET